MFGKFEQENYDPTKNSPLVKSGDLQKKRTAHKGNKLRADIYQDKETKEIFHEKKEMNKTEMFLTLLSKGVLHVSDAILYEDKMMSRHINLNHIEEAAPKEEMVAELMILKYFFDDIDHSPQGHYNFKSRNGKFSHYDYGMSTIGSGFVKAGDFKYEFIEKIEKDSLNQEVLLSQLKQKIAALKERIQDDKFLEAIYEKSQMTGEDLDSWYEKDEEILKELQEILLDKIKNFEDNIADITNPSKKNNDWDWYPNINF